MIARALSVVAFAIAIVACASIDAPAPFDKPEAGSDPSIADGGAPFDRCRVLPRTFSSNATAKVYGDPSGAQAVCVTLDVDVPLGGGSGSVVFCVAGKLDTPSLRPPRSEAPRDVGVDLASCAYCVDVQTGCSDGDGSATRSCTTSYAPVRGHVRFVSLSRTPGDAVWIDIGGLVVQRVERRDAGVVLEPADCLFADGLTFQGTLVAASAASCSGLEATACDIANTATSRFP